MTAFVSADDRHGSPSADQGARFVRGRSIGARLPWSDWARKYIGLVGKEGASHVLFAASTLNPQHATFMNVTFGSSFDADDTHVGAMLHPGVAVWSAALATAE